MEDSTRSSAGGVTVASTTWPRIVALTGADNEYSDSSPVYRHRDFANALCASPHPNVFTIYDIIQRSAALYPKANAVGARPLLRVIKEMRDVPSSRGSGAENTVRKEWSVFVLGKYYWMTYAELFAASRTLGTALTSSLKLPPRSIAAIYAKTCPEWQIAAQACFTQNMVIATCYESLGLDALKYSLNETEASLVFVHSELISNFLKVVDECKHIRHVIVLSPYVCQYNSSRGRAPDLPADYAELATVTDAMQKLREKAPSINSVVLYDLMPPETVAALAQSTIARRQSSQGLSDPKTQQSSPTLIPPSHATSLPATSDLACIMYTSGSTGAPKGVMLSHGNIVGAVGGMLGVIPTVLRPEIDVYLAFLPLAHVLEFVVECVGFYSGVALGYGHPRTLSDLSVRDCVNDIRELAPTFMAGVPAVWEAIQKRIREQLDKAPAIVQGIFRISSRLKVWSFNNRFDVITTIIDSTVMRRVRNLTGGRLRFCLSGGAPIAPSTQLFLSGSLCPIIQGYGMTETCGGGALFNFGMPLLLGTAGPVIGALEMRLVPVEHAPQYNPRGPKPAGELLLRGTCVFQGYFKRDDLTAEVKSSDGWFSTGDVASIDPLNGSLSIVDRAKNLVKLANGEYIALEKLESLYSTVPVVARICVIADPFWSFIVAVIQPLPAALCSLVTSATSSESNHDSATGTASTTKTWQELCQDTTVVPGLVLKELQKAAARLNLAPAETIKGVLLSDEEWTPDNGFLTAAMKLRRREIQDRFREKILSLHASLQRS